MCVLAFAWRVHPHWPLVLAGNRDELHARPTLPLHRWEDAPHVLGGVDLASGGTWLGVSERGRLAVVTNLRGYGPPAEGRPSRGQLTRTFLVEPDARADLSSLELATFNPFDLIGVDGEGALFAMNRPDSRIEALPPGLYGLSNGALDEPWPKTMRLKAALRGWLDRGDWDGAALFAALADEARPADEALPSTGLDLERERLSSAIFIRHPVYGTRCSTVVTVDSAGRGEIAERRFGPDGLAEGETRLAFCWP